MGIKVNNLSNLNRKVVNQLGAFSVIEYEKDSSVNIGNAQVEYFMGKMGVRRRQVLVNLNNSAVTVQAGSMQWMAGPIQAGSGVKGVGDLVLKKLKSSVTKESTVKPLYSGSGQLMLEPTYKYILLLNVGEWGRGVTIEDGMFLACDQSVQQKIVARSSISSAVMGGEGLFNLSLQGTGVAALESNVPMEELIKIELDNDTLKVDGNLAVCWSSNLDFTVERTTKTLTGSAISGEGFVNVYRGTGKVLMCPVAPTKSLYDSTSSMAGKAAAVKSNTFGK